MVDPRGARVAALLLNYRGAQMTLQCLRDLLAVDDVDLTVIVIDNASGQPDVDALRSGIAAITAEGLVGSRHELHLLALTENCGFAGGMNRGIEFASARDVPFVLILNNDMRLPRDFVRPLRDVLVHDSAVGAVGPTVVHPDGTVWAEGGEVGFTPNSLRLRGHGKAPSARTAGPEDVGFLTGACMMLRTQTATEVGGFDDSYFMYWEDVELSDKLRRHGQRVVWLPWVRVEHLGGQSSGGGRSPLRKFLMACNAVRFLKARGTVKTWAGWLLFDVLLWPLTLAGGRRAAWAKLCGTFAGLRGHRASAADVARYLRG